MLISFVLNLTKFFVYNMALLSSVRLCIVKRRFLACVACVRDYGMWTKKCLIEGVSFEGTWFMMLSDSSETKWIKHVYKNIENKGLIRWSLNYKDYKDYEWFVFFFETFSQRISAELWPKWCGWEELDPIYIQETWWNMFGCWEKVLLWLWIVFGYS